MADNPIGELKVDPNLTVDAGKIYAKLHLAGKSQVQGFLVVNTGMKDEGNNDTPENPGKATFDLNNKSGEYEVCFISDTPTDLFLKVDMTKVKEIEDIKKKSTAPDKEDDMINTLRDAYTKILNVGEDGKFKDKEAEKQLKDAKTEDDMKKAVEKTNELREKTLNEPDDKIKADATKACDAYFKAFAGDDYKNIQADLLVLLKFNENVKDNKSIKIKDFKIESLDEASQKKLADAFYKDLTKPIKMKLGFKVKFTINKD